MYGRARHLEGLYLELQYWVFYPYKGAHKILRVDAGGVFDPDDYDELLERHYETGTHDGNGRSIRIRLIENNVYGSSFHEPINIGLADHNYDHDLEINDPAVTNTNNWPIKASDPAVTTVDDNRRNLIVYSASKTHAQYLTQDRHEFRRVGGEGEWESDLTNDRGSTWRSYFPENLQLISTAWPDIEIDAPDWLYFYGQWGGFNKTVSDELQYDQEDSRRWDIGSGEPSLMLRPA